MVWGYLLYSLPNDEGPCRLSSWAFQQPCLGGNLFSYSSICSMPWLQCQVEQGPVCVYQTRGDAGRFLWCNRVEPTGVLCILPVGARHRAWAWLCPLFCWQILACCLGLGPCLDSPLQLVAGWLGPLLLTWVTAMLGRVHILYQSSLYPATPSGELRTEPAIPIPGRPVICGDTPSLSICFESWPGVLMLRGCSCPHVLEITLHSPASQ